MKEPFSYKRFETRESLEQGLFALLTAVFQDADAGEPQAVMLSGGSTPASLYQRIADSGIRAGEGLYLLLSDERLVPRGSPDANLTMVRPMAEAIGLPEERLITVAHDRPAAEAAEGYHEALTELNGKGVSRRLALLGVGDDGHTASIFAAEEATRPHTVLAEAVAAHAGFERITTTPEEILSYRQVILFAAGAKKRPILEALVNSPGEYPAGIIARRSGVGELWTDQPLGGAEDRGENRS